LHGIFGRGEVTELPHDRAEDRRRELAQSILEARRVVHESLVGAPITSRTSIGCWIGTPFGPGAADACAAISSARASESTSIIR
jgi:hypothetical protein